MKENLLAFLAGKEAQTIPAISEAIDADGLKTRAVLSELLAEKKIRVIVEGCQGCACGSCPPATALYTLV